jgi:hypothetical protein
MSDFTFDTHAEIRKLEQSGIPVPHAEAVVDMVTRAPINTQVAEGMRRLERLEQHIEKNMATKADLATLRTETKAGLTALRADLYRALWLQGGALAGLILVLAGYALTS